MPAYRGPDGKIVYASDEDAGRFEAGGYERVGEAAAGMAQNRIAPVDNGITGSIGATVSAGLSGATLGASDWLLKGVLDKGQFEQMAQDRADNPGLSGAAQFAGAFLPAVVSGGTATPSGYLSHLAAEGIGSAEAVGGAAGAARSLAIAGTEGAIQNAGAYLSDVALGDRDLTAEGMVGALGTGFAFGGGGLIAGHGIVAGTTAARRMFARYAAGGEEAAQAAQAAWQEQGAKALESFDQAEAAAKAQLQEAQLARQQADLARKQASAAVAEAKVAPPPDLAGAGGPVAPVPGQPPGDVELAGMMRDRAMAATDPQRMAAWDAQNGQRLQELMAARTPTGEVDLGEPSAPTNTAIARRTDDLNGLMSQLKAMSAPQEAELASKLNEYRAARDAFDSTHASVDPDLDEVLRGSLGGNVQREPVPVGEFGAPGARGYKPGEVPAPGPPSQAPLAGAAEGTPVTRALRKGAVGEPTKAFDFKDSGLTFDPETRQYTTAEAGAGPGEPPMPEPSKGKYNAAGGVIVNGEGKIAIVKTKGGEHEWMLPKGRIDPGETPAQAALREVREESGAKAEVGPHIGDYDGNFSKTRFYLMRHSGDDLAAMAKDGEMASVKFVSPDEAERLLSHPMNKRALADARKMLDEHGPDFWAGAHVSGKAKPLTPDEFSQYAEQWRGGLSKEATDALETYSRNGTYGLINAPLRSSGGDLSHVPDWLHGTVAEVDKAVAAAPAPRDLVAFRGLNGRRSTAQWAEAKVGDSIVDHGFGSASASQKVGQDYASGMQVRPGVELRIDVPKGYPAAPIPSSIFGGESELLLPRNTKYTVTKIEQASGGKIVHVTASPASGAVEASAAATDINAMSLKQLDAHMGKLEELRNELDVPGKRGPELERVRQDIDAAYERHRAIRKGEVAEPSGAEPHASAVSPSPADDLLSQLQGTAAKLGEGRSIGEIGAESPARAEYASKKLAKRKADASYFRAKANGAPSSDYQPISERAQEIPGGGFVMRGPAGVSVTPVLEPRVKSAIEEFEPTAKKLKLNERECADGMCDQIEERFRAEAPEGSLSPHRFDLTSDQGMQEVQKLYGLTDEQVRTVRAENEQRIRDAMEDSPRLTRAQIAEDFYHQVSVTKDGTAIDWTANQFGRDLPVPYVFKLKAAAPEDGGDLLAALQGTNEGLGAGRSMRELSGAPMVSERAVAAKRLEMAHDDAMTKPAPEPMTRPEFTEFALAHDAGLSEMTRSEINSWSTHEGMSLNDLLREGAPIDRYSAASIRELDSALTPLPRDIVAYRGVDDNIPGLQALKPGDVITDPGYQSLSFDQRVAMNFAKGVGKPHLDGGTLLHVRAAAGSRVVPIIGTAAEEGELLLPRGSKIRITGTREMKWGMGTKYRILDAELVPVVSASEKSGAVEDVAAMAPVVHRLEKAAADLTEALGDAAPAAAKEHAAAFRQAEDVASEKSAARVARAADDHATAREQAQADDLVNGPSAKERAVAAAKRQRAEAEAAYQKARVAEAEASIGAKRAASAASEARANMPPSPAGAAPAARGHGNRLVSGAHAIGYAAELGSDLGIPGIPRPHDIPVIGPLLSAYLKYRAFRAAAGRFVGRIPATAETRAAELAARTRDGIARSMDRSLGLVERNPTAVRAALTLGAVQASKALSKRLIDDGKPDAADGASVSALAAVRMREVAAAVANPALISDMVRKQTRDVMDPELIRALENHLQSMFSHLNDTAPKGPPPNPLTKQDWKPPVAAATQWAQRVAVANNPQVAFDLLEAGKLTPAAADTLRVCYQKLFAEAQARLAQRAADLEHPVPYRQLMQAGLLFDTATHASLDPENATVMQQAHVAPPQVTPQPTAPPVPGIAAPTNITSLYQTTADRRASR